MTSKLNATNLSFTDASANTGALSFASNEFSIDKPASFSAGLSSTQVSVSGSGQVAALSSVSSLDIDTLNLEGSTSGTTTVQAAATTTSHTLTLPPAQGASGSYLENDGSGALSWAVVNEGSSGASGNDRFKGYFDIGSHRICYGEFTLATDNPTTVTLPASFGSANYSVTVSVNTTSGNWVGSGSIGTPIKITGRASGSFEIDRDDDMAGTAYVSWQAIGLK